MYCSITLSNGYFNCPGYRGVIVHTDEDTRTIRILYSTLCMHRCIIVLHSSVTCSTMVHSRFCRRVLCGCPMASPCRRCSLCGPCFAKMHLQPSTSLVKKRSELRRFESTAWVLLPCGENGRLCNSCFCNEIWVWDLRGGRGGDEEYNCAEIWRF